MGLNPLIFYRREPLTSLPDQTDHIIGPDVLTAQLITPGAATEFIVYMNLHSTWLYSPLSFTPFKSVTSLERGGLPCCSLNKQKLRITLSRRIGSFNK